MTGLKKVTWPTQQRPHFICRYNTSGYTNPFEYICVGKDTYFVGDGSSLCTGTRTSASSSP